MNFIELKPTAQSSFQNNLFFTNSTKLFENGNSTFPLVRYFALKLKFALNILPGIVCGNNFLLLIHPRPVQTYFV